MKVTLNSWAVEEKPIYQLPSMSSMNINDNTYETKKADNLEKRIIHCSHSITPVSNVGATGGYALLDANLCFNE